MTLPPLPKPDLLVFDVALQSPAEGWTRSQVALWTLTQTITTRLRTRDHDD